MTDDHRLLRGKLLSGVRVERDGLLEAAPRMHPITSRCLGISDVSFVSASSAVSHSPLSPHKSQQSQESPSAFVPSHCCQDSGTEHQHTKSSTGIHVSLSEFTLAASSTVDSSSSKLSSAPFSVEAIDSGLPKPLLSSQNLLFSDEGNMDERYMVPDRTIIDDDDVFLPREDDEVLLCGVVTSIQSRSLPAPASAATAMMTATAAPLAKNMPRFS